MVTEERDTDQLRQVSHPSNKEGQEDQEVLARRVQRIPHQNRVQVPGSQNRRQPATRHRKEHQAGEVPGTVQEVLAIQERSTGWELQVPPVAERLEVQNMVPGDPHKPGQPAHAPVGGEIPVQKH